MGPAPKNGNASVVTAEASPVAKGKPGSAPPVAAGEKKLASKPGKPSSNSTPEDVLARMDKLEQAVSKLVESQTSFFAHGATYKIPKLSNAHGAKHDHGSSATTSGHATGSCSPMTTATSLEDALEIHSQEPDLMNFSDSDDDGGLLSSQLAPSGVTTDKGSNVPMMAARFASPSGVGDPLDTDIADTINFMMVQKLDEKALKETNEKYSCPANAEFTLIVPKVNPEIWEMISSAVKTRDLRLQCLQKSLVKGITAFAQNLSSDNLTEAQQDGLALLCDTNFQLCTIRKEGIKPDLGQFGRKLCKRQVKSSQYLFGDDLGQTLKEFKDEKKAMEGIMKQPSSSHYHPYQRTNDTRPKQSTAQKAGWSTGNFASASKQTGGKPFLGQWKGQHNFKEGPRSHNQSARTDEQKTKFKGQPQRHGQGRK